MRSGGAVTVASLEPDHEYHDTYGRHYLLLGSRMLRDGQVLPSPLGCPTVVGCRLIGDRLLIEYERGTLECPSVYEGPPPHDAGFARGTPVIRY